MKILILNWRDIKNPEAGGAEVLTQEMAKRWVKWGHQVIQISSGFSGSKKEEVVDGVRIIRLGRWWNIHLLAFLYYFKNLRRQTDVIVDEVHWFPFFSALYARKKTVLLVCEVASKLFFQLFPYPLALLGRLVEKIYFRCYRHLPVLAISPSTKKDLIKEGFREKDITIIPMGLTLPKRLKIYPKEKIPTLIYLGRLNKQKGIEDALMVMAKVKKNFAPINLWVVGSGDSQYLKKLEKRVADLGLKVIKFFGFVSEEKKFALLSRAQLLLVPSFHEGWGLVVPEAGRVGTPVVAYQVAGLQDVVKNGVNGVLVKPYPDAMVQAIITLLNSPQKLAKLSDGALREAKKYGWHKTAKKALVILEKIRTPLRTPLRCPR